MGGEIIHFKRHLCCCRWLKRPETGYMSLEWTSIRPAIEAIWFCSCICVDAACLHNWLYLYMVVFLWFSMCYEGFLLYFYSCVSSYAYLHTLIKWVYLWEFRRGVRILPLDILFQNMYATDCGVHDDCSETERKKMYN